MEKTRLIPFALLPAAWGLKGQAYAEAEAAYYLEGEALERKLAEIRLADDPDALRRKNLDLDVKFGKKTAFERDRVLLEASMSEGIERDLALLDLDLKHGKLRSWEYERKKADLRGEPWIGIKDHGFEPEQGIGGMFFEFDWNEAWIELLRLNGYVGSTDDQLVEQWFADLSRMVADETPDLGSMPLHRRVRPGMNVIP